MGSGKAFNGNGLAEASACTRFCLDSMYGDEYIQRLLFPKKKKSN